MNNKPYLIIMIGLPGSGKSTYAEKIIADKSLVDSKLGFMPTDLKKMMFPEWNPIIHSSDSLRKELFGDETVQGDNNKLFAELHRRIKNDLYSGKDVIYDATNLKKKNRIQFLHEVGLDNCIPIACCTMATLDECLSHNKSRDRTVPDEVIKRMRMNWQPPDYSEGFVQISYQFPYYRCGDFVTNGYTLEDYKNKISNFEQENKHHSLTLGEHCSKAAQYINEKYPCNHKLITAAVLHDNGKLYTKTKINAKGIDDGDCHYYQHHCVGAYESIFYLTNLGFNAREITYISNLIYYHMHPYVEWKQSDRVRERDKNILSEDMYNDILILHRADSFAH